jgi:hypothetical protein
MDTSVERGQGIAGSFLRLELPVRVWAVGLVWAAG